MLLGNHGVVLLQSGLLAQEDFCIDVAGPSFGGLPISELGSVQDVLLFNKDLVNVHFFIFVSRADLDLLSLDGRHMDLLLSEVVLELVD